MTRKDYELIAKVIMEWSVSENAECLPLVNRFVAALEKDNSRFNRGTFIGACTVAAYDIRKIQSK